MTTEEQIERKCKFADKVLSALIISDDWTEHEIVETVIQEGILNGLIHEDGDTLKLNE